jgi:hypothetical protein
MPRKEFEAFTRLDASDVNTFLMDQTVMSFAGTAARGSAIPSPVEGMYTHLEDTPQRLQVWNGSAWVSPFGSTLLRTTDFTSQTTVAFDNVFTTEFRNYTAVINAVGTTGTTMQAQMRGGGSPITTTTYNYQVNDISATTYFAARVTAANHVGINTISTARDMLADVLIGNPAFAKNTTFIANGYYPNISVSNLYGENTNATAYDGIQFLVPAGTMTGSISIYGLRK